MFYFSLWGFEKHTFENFVVMFYSVIFFFFLHEVRIWKTSPLELNFFFLFFLFFSLKINFQNVREVSNNSLISSLFYISYVLLYFVRIWKIHFGNFISYMFYLNFVRKFLRIWKLSVRMSERFQFLTLFCSFLNVLPYYTRKLFQNFIEVFNSSFISSLLLVS